MDRLISYCLDRSDLSLLWAFPKELLDESDQEIINFIRDEMTRFGNIPSKHHVAKHIDSFLPAKSTKKLTTDVLSDAIRRKINDAWRSFIAQSDDLEEHEREEEVKDLLRKVSAKPIQVHEFSTFDRTNYFASAKGTLSIFTPYITSVTGGIAKGEIAYVIGRYGVGKTLLMQHNILSWYLQGKRTLVISNDMPSQLMMGRFDALVTGIDNKRFKLDKVDKGDIRLKVLHHLSRNLKGDIIIPKGQVRNVDNLWHLHRTFETDAIVIDGVYFMGSPARGKITRGWETMSEVSGELKQISKELKVPIIGVHQANKQGEVAYSDSLGQDADLIVSLTKDGDQEDDKGRPKHLMDVNIELTKNRTGPPFTSECTFDFQRFVLFEKRTAELV